VWVRRARDEGETAARHQGQPRGSKLDDQADFLLDLVAVTPLITLREMQQRLYAERGLSAGLAHSGASSRPGRSPSKRTAHAAEQDRTDIAAAREAWFDRQPDFDPERLVFIDETGAGTKMARLRGRAPRGERLRGSVPHGHWKTTTFVVGLRLTGLTAPMLLDGPMTAQAFEGYVEKVLCPTLCPGDTVILDNLAAYKRRETRRAIEATGASLLFLPPYSPDFNPIENAFSKLKALLRKAAERTLNGLWDTIGQFLDAFTPAECANYFTAAGYEPE
jgi:transposase